MDNRTWQEEQAHLTEMSILLKSHIQKISQQLKKQKGELIGERTAISEGFNDISGERAIDFSQILPTLQIREREYLNLSEVLAKLELLYKSPYFGRIDILNEEGEPEKLYMGLSTFRDEKSGDILIYDWRAPISSLFYENKIGESRYQIPDGEYLSVEIVARRQYKIEYDKLLQLFDADIYIGDDVLQGLLIDTAKEKMKSIVSTIQSDQNKVIRSSNRSNLLVLGPPGSGKTSVAMQRIAFLLYEYRQSMSAKNILLISPSDLFNDYISNVLPELGEENVQHTTYFRLFKEMKLRGLKSETNYENIERLQKAEKFPRQSFSFKGSNLYAKQLLAYLKKIEKSGMRFYNLKMGDKLFISNKELSQLFYEKFASLDIDFRLKKIRNFLEHRLEQWKREAFEVRLKQLRDVNAYIGTDHELEQRANSEIGKRFSALIKNITTLGFVNINRLYLDSLIFDNEQPLASEIQKATENHLNKGYLYYEDLAPMMYINAIVKGIHTNNSIKHIVIDEIQDYSYLQLMVIKQLHPKAHYTLLGDKNQIVHPTMKDSLAELLSNEFITVELNKSYRSTNEITNFMSAILNNNETLSLGVTGDKPVVMKGTNHVHVIKELLQHCYAPNDSFVIICKNMAACKELYTALKPAVEQLILITEEQKEYMKGILIMPGYMAKGFEFTTVVLADGDENVYSDEMDSYLLYTIASRATRRLFVLYKEKLSSPLQLIDTNLYNKK